MLFVSRKTHTDSLFTVSLESGEQDEKGIIIVLSNFLLLNYSASWWCRLHNGFSSKNFHKCSVSAAWQQLSMVLWLRRAWCLEGLSLLICVWGVSLDSLLHVCFLCDFSQKWRHTKRWWWSSSLTMRTQLERCLHSWRRRKEAAIDQEFHLRWSKVIRWQSVLKYPREEERLLGSNELQDS